MTVFFLNTWFDKNVYPTIKAVRAHQDLGTRHIKILLSVCFVGEMKSRAATESIPEALQSCLLRAKS
jgi:hypothetical protein